MSLKPPPLPTEQVAEQAHALQQQQAQLEQQRDVLENRLQSIESSLGENENLRKQVEVLMAESLSHSQEEWKRKSEYYPDIRLQILQKALELLAGKPKPTA
jgi:hypothetical protein